MHGTAAGKGPVGYLIVLIAGGGKGRADELILHLALVVIDFNVLSDLVELTQIAVVVDGQMISGNVLRVPFQHLLHSSLQHLKAHPVDAVDYVHADVVEACLP